MSFVAFFMPTFVSFYSAHHLFARQHSILSCRRTLNWPLRETDFALANASSLARDLPTAGSLTNVIITCQDGAEENGHLDSSSSDSPSSDSSSSDSPPESPCSQGSTCVEGDVGVYCQCYLQRSTSDQVRPTSGRKMLIYSSSFP